MQKLEKIQIKNALLSITFITIKEINRKNVKI